MTVAKPTTVIVLHYGDPKLTEACLDALHEHTPGVDIIVADNGTGDFMPFNVQQYTFNLGFAGGNNRAAQSVTTPRITFLNNDTLVHPGWLEPLLEGDIVGSRLVYPDGTLQHAGIRFDTDGGVLHGHNIHDDLPSRPVKAVTGACLTIRTELFHELNGFDTAYWNGNEDCDLCLRALDIGATIRFERDSVVTHLESQAGPERWKKVRENVTRFSDRWKSRPDLWKE